MYLECLNCEYTTDLIPVDNYRCPKCAEVLYPKTLDKISISSIMGEGNTPMYRNVHLTEMVGCNKLGIKNEGVNPTGSFKDRGTAFELGMATNYSYSKVVLASTGNMGASMAAYCAYHNYKCIVFVPEDTGQNKIDQMEMYGAQIKIIKGDYFNCMLQAENYAYEYEDVFLVGDYFWRMVGMTSLGDEILIQNNGMPDYIFVPVGNGNLLYSIFLSLNSDFYKPKIIGVQIECFDDLFYEFTFGEKRKIDFHDHKTPATAINITNPLQSKGVLKAVKETDGRITYVTDKDMMEARDILSKKGLYLEPSGAVAFAGVLKHKELLKDKDVVCIGTGNGMKGI